MSNHTTAFSFGAFTWFVGEVVDINDPLKAGRVKVKIFGYHTETGNVDKKNLPWAMVMSGTNSASTSSIGSLPHALIVGSHILGFYTDGESAQSPMVLGSFPGMSNGKTDVSPLAKGNNTVKVDKTGPEPSSTYAAEYPHNKVTQTTSGHIIEIDDSPSAERIHIRHKSGTYYVINPDGTCVRKCVSGLYEVVIGDGQLYFGGNVIEEIKGNYDCTVSGNYTLKAGGSVNLQSGNNTNIKSGANFNMQASASANLKAGGIMKCTAAIIRLN